MKQSLIALLTIVAGVYGIPIPAHVGIKPLKFNGKKVWNFTKHLPSVACMLVVALFIAGVVSVSRLVYKPKEQHYESFSE